MRSSWSSKAVPRADAAERDQALAKAQEILLGFGVTGVGSTWARGSTTGTPCGRAGEAGRLNVRIMAMPTGSKLLAIVADRPTAWLYGDRLRMGGIKLYADGALGSRGAWLKQPYSDKPDTRGLQFHSGRGAARRMADDAAARGFQIATHAIGDAANAQVIARL